VFQQLTPPLQNATSLIIGKANITRNAINSTMNYSIVEFSIGKHV